MSDTPQPFTPGQTVTLLQPLGGRRRLRNNFCAGMSFAVPARVVKVNPSSVTIEVEGVERRVKARNLRAA